MKRLRPLGLVLMAAFALGAVVSATASANPTILPTPSAGEPLNFTSKGGVARLLVGGTTIECKEATNKGSFTSSELGTVEIAFTGCTVVGAGTKCKAGGDVNGTILIKVPIHIVDILTPALSLGILFLLLEANKVLLTCGVLNVEVSGDVLGLIDGPKTLVKTSTGNILLHSVKNEKKVQEFRECDELPSLCIKEGKNIVYELLARFKAEEAFKPGVEEAEDTITLAKEVEFHF